MTILELMYLSICIFHFDKENHQGEERRHKPVKLLALEKFKERRHKQQKSSHCPAVLTTIEVPVLADLVIVFKYLPLLKCMHKM